MTRAIGRRWFWLGLSAGLSGCGFQPIYMPTATGKAGVAQRELAAVNVSLMYERPGQLLRQALQDHLGSDSGTPLAYDLHVAFGIGGEGIGIETNNIATRVRLIGTASWTLSARDAAHSTLTSGSARALDGLNILNEQYFAADLESEAVQQRMADLLAQQITIQLAMFFRKRAAAAG